MDPFEFIGPIWIHLTNEIIDDSLRKQHKIKEMESKQSRACERQEEKGLPQHYKTLIMTNPTGPGS